VVGSLSIISNLGAAAIVQTAGLSFALPVGGATGFPDTIGGGAENLLWYTDGACTTVGGIVDADSYVPLVLVAGLDAFVEGGILYYPTALPVTQTAGSFGDPGDPDLDVDCDSVSDIGSIPVAPVSTLTLSTLGFTPPFSVQ